MQHCGVAHPIAPRLVRRILNGQGGLRVRGPERALSDDMVSWLRENIQKLLEALRDRQKARKKRSAILEYITALHANKRMLRPTKRIRFVTCESCSNGAGQNSCGARMLTSGDPFPRAVYARCNDCQGEDGTDPGWLWAIGICEVSDCPLYPRRPYQHKVGQSLAGMCR